MAIGDTQRLLVLSIPVTLQLMLSACGPKPEPQAPGPVTVRVGKVRTAKQPEATVLSGSVESPGDPSDASFLVAGKVAEAGPREGDLVRKGRLLAALDATDYQIALDAAAAQTAMARALLEKAEQPARPETLEQARLAFQRSEDEYRRMKSLHDSKSIAPNDFQKFETAYLAAREQFNLAKAGAQKEDKAQAKAALDQAMAAERLAAKRLADTKLLAPIDGFVSRRMIEPGVVVAPGRPAFLIVRLDPVEIRVGVPESDLVRVRIGQRASVRVPALPGETFEGTVRLINVSADPATRTYMSRIAVSNRGHRLRLGMIAEATIQSDTATEMLTLPGEAIVRDPQGATMVYVYYPDQKRVYARRIETGAVYGNEIRIRGGLKGDETVVLGGQQGLRDGVSAEARPEGAGERR